ncbi:MAG: winged helix-turn-helix transcriptional regulator, partial [Candidatus Eremiobacteraeota bacterium]|nr:winged helix-turn-helix transcriptional regulator [Candidatus Eremiobacteraeota bacterium]
MRTSEKPATERQQRILKAIADFKAERGYPPSVREIGERVGLSSSSTIHAHLKALERRGLISRDPTKPRALRSEIEPDQAARDAVVMPILGKVAAGVPITAAENVEGEFV